jgi:hypothetical protein
MSVEAGLAAVSFVRSAPALAAPTVAPVQPAVRCCDVMIDVHVGELGSSLGLI